MYIAAQTVTPKEIGRQAGRTFQNAIPAHCAIRSQEDQEDYGIDYELELTGADDKATGFLFKVQQKGVEKATYINGGRRLSFGDLPVEKMRYYLKQVPVPIVFVVVDLSTGLVCWTPLQGNPSIETAYEEAVAANQDTMTVHLPVANRLPETFDQLLDAVGDIAQWLMVKQVKETPSLERLATSLREDEFNASAKAFARHNDVFRIERIERLLQTQNYDAAFRTAREIFDSPAESVAMRFSAAVNLLRIQPVRSRIAADPQRQERITELRLSVTRTLFGITRGNGAEERRLRPYALFLHRAARLHELVERDYGLSLSAAAQTQTGNEYTRALTEAARRPLLQAIVGEFRRMERLLRCMIQRGQLQFVAPAWIRLAGDLVPFLAVLLQEKKDDLARSLIGWLENTGSLAVEISQRLKNWPDVGGSVIQSISLAAILHNEAALDKKFSDARATIESIPDEPVRAKALRDLENLRNELRGAADSGDEADIIRQMAAAYGIDLGAEGDPIVDAVNLAIRDLNPERVLRKCRHLSASVSGGGGFTAAMLGLTTAGWKTVRCRKFGYETGALALDGAYSLMYENHCKTCAAGEPRPEGWKWSYEWQAREHEEYKQAEGIK